MTKRIFKYVLDKDILVMPKAHQILSVQLQDNNITVWALVDPTHSNINHKCKVLLTGDSFPEEDDYMHLATIQSDIKLVLHIFKRIMSHV